jgi:hypothetical protein
MQSIVVYECNNINPNEHIKGNVARIVMMLSENDKHFDKGHKGCDGKGQNDEEPREDETQIMFSNHFSYTALKSS